MVVTFLDSLVQLCCEEGGTLQTNITGVCGECSQCFSRTGFAPALGVCAFMVNTSQSPGCSAGNYLRWALGCVHFPSLSCSSSGSRVLHKGTNLVGPAFCALPRSEQFRWCLASAVTPSWRLCLIASPIAASRFSVCTMGVPSQVCHVSLPRSWSLAVTLLVDVNHPESQEVLVSNEACLQFSRGCLSGAMIARLWLWLPSPACLQRGMASLQPASSAQSFVLWAGLAVS